MAAKGSRTGGAKEEKKKGFFGSVPLGAALDVADGIGSVLFKLLLSHYRVEERIENLKEGAREKVEEIKEDAIRTGYAIKKAFFKTIIEAILLSTGLLALIAGVIILISKAVPLEYVLIGYGLIITIAILLQLQMRD